MDKVCEELGDLMLQVVIQSQVAVEAGEFSIDDVMGSISAKLVRRHPHVFGEVQVEGVSGVLKNWEKLKAAERKAKGTDEVKGLLDGVPKAMRPFIFVLELFSNFMRLISLSVRLFANILAGHLLQHHEQLLR